MSRYNGAVDGFARSQTNRSMCEAAMRKTIPSTYDPLISSAEIREFKRLLRRTSGVSQRIYSARRTSDDQVKVLTGGPIGGQWLEFSLVDGQWSLEFVGTWISCR
ncbi:MAG: hypothetical protein KDB14_18715 [Planctomycetales bacterium]|nr:hypothetical protein [Planctomycetales bacterium]